MIMLNANTPYISPVAISHSAETPVAVEEYGGTTETVLSILEFGNTVYKFPCGLTINSVADYVSRDLICWSSNLGASIAGKGDSVFAAQEDFKTELHTVFQRLYRKRPFEMNEQEQKLWQDLVTVIDVHLYKTTTPLVVREVGQISYGMISRPYRIKWLTGYNYIIDPNRVPPELMSMKTGQYVEAVVKRDPVTHRELEIVSVKPISFHLPNEQEAKRIWEEMPAADLPEGGWD